MSKSQCRNYLLSGQQANDPGFSLMGTYSMDSSFLDSLGGRPAYVKGESRRGSLATYGFGGKRTSSRYLYFLSDNGWVIGSTLHAASGVELQLTPVSGQKGTDNLAAGMACSTARESPLRLNIKRCVLQGFGRTFGFQQDTILPHSCSRTCMLRAWRRHLLPRLSLRSSRRRRPLCRRHH